MPKVEIVHATNPVCHWSLGYEPVLNRIERVYGDQVEFVIAQAIPYTDRKKWLQDYGMTDAEAVEFTRETIAYTKLPIKQPKSWLDMPTSCLPPTLAVKGAGLVYDDATERRLAREIMFAGLVEGRDVAQDDVLSEVITAAGLDVKRILEVVGSEGAMKALEEDAHRAGHGANFYSLLARGVGDDATTVILERAYDASRVERAVDFLGDGKLKKKKVPLSGLARYVKENPHVSVQEIATVFALSDAKARSALEDAEKKGGLAREVVKGVPNGTFWTAK